MNRSAGPAAPSKRSYRHRAGMSSQSVPASSHEKSGNEETHEKRQTGVHKVRCGADGGQCTDGSNMIPFMLNNPSVRGGEKAEVDMFSSRLERAEKYKKGLLLLPSRS